MNNNEPYCNFSIDRPSLQKVGKIISIVVFFIAILVLAWIFLTTFQAVALPILLSILLSFLLDPPVEYLESKGLSRLQATFIIFLTILFVFLIGAWLLFPVLAQQVQTIQTQIQGDYLSQRIETITLSIQEKLSFLGDTTTSTNLTEKIKSLVTTFQENILNFAMGLFSALSNLVIIPFITFFLLKDGPGMKKGLIRKVPNRYFEMVLNLTHKIELQLGGYIRGQMLDAFLVGLLSIIALYILDIDYYFFIGAIAGLANLIPYIGPVVGAVPAILVSLMQDTSLTPILLIAIAFALIQLIDNVLISPLVVAKSINIHPLVVIIVIFIGERLLGVLGMLIAVPVTGILNVIIKETIWSFRNYRLL